MLDHFMMQLTVRVMWKFFLIEAEEIRNIVETYLGTVISAAPILPGIFNAHHLQHADGKIHLKP